MEKAIARVLERGVVHVIERENLIKKLYSGKQLRIKLGCDPTSNVLHLGHYSIFLKLKQFQELGHKVILIIGDATAQVGDSSDKNSERPMLTREETTKNSQGFVSIMKKILKEDLVEFRYNSEWLDSINFSVLASLAKHFSVREMLDRENFSQRFSSGIRISLQEFLYPLLQGYDSIVIGSDVEIGGTDQYFNMLAGRKLQEAYGYEKQDVITMKLLMGLDGTKMSKTKKNGVSLDMLPREMFVKIMELYDEYIVEYFTSCTLLEEEQIHEYEQRLQQGENPRDIKMELAYCIVKDIHGEKQAQDAQEYFVHVIQQGNIPSEKDIEKVEINSEEMELPLLEVLQKARFVGNAVEAKNAIWGGGVKVNNEVIRDHRFLIPLKKDYILIQVGKKKFKMVR